MGKKRPLGRILKSGTGSKAATPAARILSKTKVAAAAAPAPRASRALPPGSVRSRAPRQRCQSVVAADIKVAEQVYSEALQVHKTAVLAQRVAARRCEEEHIRLCKQLQHCRMLRARDIVRSKKWNQQLDGRLDGLDEEHGRAELLLAQADLDVDTAKVSAEAAKVKLDGLLEEQRVILNRWEEDEYETLDQLVFNEYNRRVVAEETYWRSFPNSGCGGEVKWSGPEPEPPDPWMRKPPGWGEWGPDGYIPPPHCEGLDDGEPEPFPPPAVCSAPQWCPACCDNVWDALCGKECLGWCRAVAPYATVQLQKNATF